MHYSSCDGKPARRRPVSLAVVAQQPVDESGNRRDCRLRCFTVGHMADAGENGGLYRAITFALRRLDLRDGAVLVLFALHNENRHPDIAERFVNIPCLEGGIEPRSVP